MPFYKLTYYDARGAAEPIRLIFAYAGVKYEDFRLALGPITPETKKELPYGQVPVLEIDGVKYAQGVAIARYLAKQYKLTGKDDLEALKCDEIVDAMRDYTILWMFFFGTESEEKKAELKKKLIEVDTPLHLTRFNNILVKSGSKWMVGNGPTWADIFVTHFIRSLPKAWGVDLEVKKNYPELDKLSESVEYLPGIKDWIASRPGTQF